MSLYDGPGDRAVDAVFRTRGDAATYTGVVGGGVSVTIIRRNNVTEIDIGDGFMQSTEPRTELQLRISEAASKGIGIPELGASVVMTASGDAFVIDKPARVNGRRYHLVVKPT